MRIINIKTASCKCRLCGYEWNARVENPRQCVRCKRVDWHVENIKIKNGGVNYAEREKARSKREAP
jgi:hypothetical protein